MVLLLLCNPISSIIKVIQSYNSNCYSLIEDSQPEKVFLRHSRLAFSEITSYKADINLRWFAITGLTPEVTIYIVN